MVPFFLCPSPFLFLSPLNTHCLSPLLDVYRPCLHFDRSQLFDTTFSLCNPSLYNNVAACSMLPRREFSFSMLRTVRVCLLRPPAHRMTLRSLLLDMLRSCVPSFAITATDSSDFIRLCTTSISPCANAIFEGRIQVRLFSQCP
jgi:hypothetical protein